uniref:Uncharacterized protein n=1 Tax=Octactis speculum TaxID=3111310 RepID=A0A7S2C5U6_9STRA|mmetsp:Transcript_31697/g.42944  ORF Transcript_31697/g.42944 Transcript_31697/m.42944 type:complete len:220 (+) Transcript_31697:45-704(+)
MEKVQANLKEVHEKASEYDAQLNALETKTAHFSVRNGFDKLAATIRGKIPWSKKRGFDLWKNFVMVKRSESDLRRATMRVQVATNRLNFERAGMDETEQSVRRARTEGAVLLMFYRWRSHVDRVIRAEEANTFASERERLVKTLNEMRDLMTQSFRAEKKAFATAIVQGERFDVKVGLAHDKLQEYCTDISSVAKATGALTEGQTMENITPTKNSANLT